MRRRLGRCHWELYVVFTHRGALVVSFWRMSRILELPTVEATWCDAPSDIWMWVDA